MSESSSGDQRTARAVRGYQLLEQIGTGAFAVVWRGRQASVDRDVAVKQIHSELASQPAFIRRFEAEAHLVARLQHPNIVPLVDFWREPDSALLVMQYLRGGTLERRLDDGPLAVDDAIRLLSQIGGALDAAHGRDIVHRDVKSANVLFDEHGNAYLTDFGIALDPTETDSSAAALSPGTPLYAAPEQLRRERVGPAADVYSLGIVAYECLAGSLPFADSTSGPELFHRQMHEPLPDLRDRHDVDQRLADAVTRATAKDPADRFGSIGDFVDAMVGTTAVRTADPLDVPNPYRGLHAFEEADAGMFFGRERLRRELVDGFEANGLRARSAILVGASGSGKSSVVRAGLVPSLRRGDVAGSDQWFITSMTPGPDPFSALGEALTRVAQGEVDELDAVLRSGPRGLLRAIRRSVGDAQTVAVFIDQFEELFVHGDDVEPFLTSLATALDEPRSPLRLLATLRADFYDRPLSHRAFATVLKHTAVDVTPLAADELEETILRPAQAVGLDFEPGLLARIVADTVGETAPLPLLQFALTELFDRRVGGLLTNEAYQDIGGLAGALAVRADRLHDAATAEEQDAIRRLFGRLTASDRVGDLRRRARVADLDTDDETHAALERFGAARLLTFDRDPESRVPTVEVAHEALLGAWPRLRQWLTEDRDTLRRVGDVATSADRWDAGGRTDSDTLRGSRLESAESLVASDPDRLRTVDVAFIRASTERAEREHRTNTKRVRRLRVLVGATGLALVVAVLAAAVALSLRSRSEQAADEARDQRDAAIAAENAADIQTLISRSGAAAAEDPTLSVLLALEANRRQPGPETERAVLDALTRLGPIVATHDPVTLGDECDSDGPVSDDGLVQYASIDGRKIEHDIDSRSSLDRGALIEPCNGWLATHDGSQVVEFDHEGQIWAYERGDRATPVALPRSDGRTYFSAAPHGPRRIVVATSETDRSHAIVQLYDADTGDPVGDPLDGFAVPGIFFTPDGHTVIISSGTVEAPDGGGPLLIIDAMTGEVKVRGTLPGRAQSFAVDVEEDAYVFAADGGLLTVDPRSGEVRSQVDLGSLVDTRGIALRADGTVAVATNGRLEIVDRELGLLAGVGLELRNVGFITPRPDGRLTVHTEQHENLVIDLDGGALVDRAVPTGRTSTWVEYSAGRVASTDIGSAEVDLIDVATGRRVRRQLRLPDGTTFGAIVASPTADGDLVTVDTQARVALWRDGEFLSMAAAPSNPGGFLSGGAGGDGVIALGVAYENGSREATLLQSVGEVEVLVRVSGFDEISTAVPSADGGLHVVAGDQLLTFDADGEQIGTVETEVCCARFGRLDPTSGRIALGGDQGFYVYDPDIGRTTVFDTTSNISNAALVRNGDQLVVGQRDGTFQLWDVGSGQLVGVLFDGEANTLGTPTYDADTDSVWLAVPGRAIEVPLDPDVWVERACEVAGRELTTQEWADFVPGDVEQAPACS